MWCCYNPLNGILADLVGQAWSYNRMVERLTCWELSRLQIVAHYKSKKKGQELGTYGHTCCSHHLMAGLSKAGSHELEVSINGLSKFPTQFIGREGRGKMSLSFSRESGYSPTRHLTIALLLGWGGDYKGRSWHPPWELNWRMSRLQTIRTRTGQWRQNICRNPKHKEAALHSFKFH